MVLKGLNPAHINLSVGNTCQNALCSAYDTTKAETAAVWRLSIALSVLNLGAVQIEHSTWQHRIALQFCVAHCLCSLSTLRCDVEKSLRTTNEKVFRADINLICALLMAPQVPKRQPYGDCDVINM